MPVLYLVLAYFFAFATSECTPCIQCQGLGLMDDVSKFVSEPDECNDRQWQDLRNVSQIFDLTCCRTKGFYHPFVDCLVPSLPTLRLALEASGNVTIVVPTFLEKYYKIMLPVDTSHSSINTVVYNHAHKTCYLTSSPPIYEQSPHKARMPQADIATLRQLLLNGITTWQTTPLNASLGRTMTILQRHGTRSFVEFDAIVKAFQEAFPDWSVQTYHGNETAAQALAQFAKSRVIVGWHGAGLAGALFSDPGTIVLEYTTLADIDEMREWRSNEVIAKIHGNLTWIKHVVDMEHLENGNTTVMRTISRKRGKDRDMYIKGLKKIRLTPADLLNSVSHIKKEIDKGSVCV